MKHISYLAIIGLTMSLQALNAQQKIGHINSVMLMDSLPEAKKLAEQLKQYESSLSKTGEEMVAKFQANVAKYQQDMQAGNLTMVQQKDIESNLEVEQGTLDNYRKSAQESLEKRRAELVKPLLDKINNAIKEVGKEGNYSFIFDSGQSLLFVTESNDVFKEVYKKLNP